jgi:hypothetical protein
MCLPDFKRFEKIKESEALIGYRNWRLSGINPTTLISEYQDYRWNKIIEGPHIVKYNDSGIYAYNNNNDYNYNYNNDYNYNNSDHDNNNYYNYNNNNNYNEYNYNYYYNYILYGVIKQYGRVAIHEVGQRSQYAEIKTLFTIRELDATGPKEFLDWIKFDFNPIIIELSKKYKCKTQHLQDFIELTR